MFEMSGNGSQCGRPTSNSLLVESSLAITMGCSPRFSCVCPGLPVAVARCAERVSGSSYSHQDLACCEVPTHEHGQTSTHFKLTPLRIACACDHLYPRLASHPHRQNPTILSQSENAWFSGRGSVITALAELPYSLHKPKAHSQAQMPNLRTRYAEARSRTR
jgi:hypothetical protein